MRTKAEHISAAQDWGLAAWLSGMDPYVVASELKRRWNVRASSVLADWARLNAASLGVSLSEVRRPRRTTGT